MANGYKIFPTLVSSLAAAKAVCKFDGIVQMLEKGIPSREHAAHAIRNGKILYEYTLTT